MNKKYLIGSSQLLMMGLALKGYGEVNVQDDRSQEKPNIIYIVVDDMGYGDLGAYGHHADVRTPNLDRLAADGVLFTRGYVTAATCVPSRAGIVTGRHQNAFGLDDNLSGPLPFEEFTVAERLQEAGYVTGIVGKWHLEIAWRDQPAPGETPHYHSLDHLPHRHGFEEMFSGYTQGYTANFDLEGNRIGGDGYQNINDRHFRVDIQTRAALTFLDRRKTDDRPFFLYLSWYAPHSPVEGPPQYMERLAHVEDPVRRKGLSTILAIDDGVGLLRDKLRKMDLTENTLIIFISDNGAPLMEGSYIGSFNTPLTGQKAMLVDGGLQVPLIMAWPDTIPGGQVFDEMVSSLDASATTVAITNAPVDERIEGTNLMPWLTGARTGPVHEALYWRANYQAAVRTNEWTFVYVGDGRRYLFAADERVQEARNNRMAEYPEIAERLESQLIAKAKTWARLGLPTDANPGVRRVFDVFVDRSEPYPPGTLDSVGHFIPWDQTRPQTPPDAPLSAWQAGAR